MLALHFERSEKTMRREMVSWCLGVVLVLGSAWWVQRSNAAVVRELQKLNALAAEPRVVQPTRCVASVDSNAVRAELQRVLASVSRLPAAGSTAAAAGETKPVEQGEPENAPAPSPDVIAAFDEAGALLDTSLGRGTWTDGDARHLNQLMARLDPDGRQAMALRLVKSLNDGKLRRTGKPGTLF
jgi:hypothetical protein